MDGKFCADETLEPDITDPIYAERLQQLIDEQNVNFNIVLENIADLVFAN